MKREIRLSGTGGQGLITAGIILSDAALRAGMEVTMSQSYGPEARGGASKAEVIIGDEPIHFPRVLNPWLVLVMSQQAYDRYGQELAPNGTMVIDSSEVSGDPDVEGEVVKLPISRTAREELRPVVANVLALGVIAGLTELIAPDCLEEAVLARVPRGTEELNLRAFRMGLEMGQAVA
jgi:2-oxoglutarate ferredoxin oxidoreductase subunit gamma